MITLISGSDRRDSNSLKVAKWVENFYKEKKVPTQLIDLAQFPHALFQAENYGSTNQDFQVYQEMILNPKGIITIVPEYNGSFPGALKYFIDLLKFPESFNGMHCAMIGVAAGAFGGLRAVEHLEGVYHYRLANLFGKRVFFQRIHEKLSSDGKQITDKFTQDLLEDMLNSFAKWINMSV